MKPLIQTKFGNKEGNCLSTCIACLLNYDDPEKVPNFCAEHPDNGEWLEALNKWLGPKTGLQALLLDRNAAGLILGYWIASGKSPRGDFDHCVIYKGANKEHDPHPDKTFLDGRIKDCLVLVPLDPGINYEEETAWIKKYLRLRRDLLDCAGDEEKEDAVRDELDVIWYSMTEDERNRLREYLPWLAIMDEKTI